MVVTNTVANVIFCKPLKTKYMNKIISKLLSVQFPTVDLKSLMEIINATPNPELATEILCGLYEEPELPYKVIGSKSYKNATLTRVKYDKWSNKVKFSYTKEKMLGVKISKTTDTSLITLENYKEFEAEDWDKWYYLPTGEYEFEEDYTYVETWLNYEIVEPTYEDFLNEEDYFDGDESDKITY